MEIYINMLSTKKNTTKKIIYSLSNNFGINTTLSKYICKNNGINPTISMTLINKNKINVVKDYTKKHFQINDQLKKQLNFSKKHLIEIKSYRGLRNWHGLPTRGQRTHTNAKTKRKFKFTK